MLHLRELWGLCRAVLFRETERLWENWLIAKTAFPSPRCDMSCARLVGAAIVASLVVLLAVLEFENGSREGEPLLFSCRSLAIFGWQVLCA